MEHRQSLRFVIIGGVAGGASAAARARRLSEHAHITVIERGPDVSFANCGLPYYIGDEITDRSRLALHTPESLRQLLNIDIRTHTEALRIDRARKTITVRTREGQEEHLPYDKLLLAPGASPLRPNLPGIDDPRIMTLRTLQDMDRIKTRMASADRVMVVGAGFIGLEMVEMLVRLKKQVTLVEIQKNVLPHMDREMTAQIEAELANHGVVLALGDGLAGFSCVPEKIIARLNSGKQIEADAVILSIGVRCESSLAEQAGLALGQRGSIRVNEFMQTADPDIYAVGDAVETQDPICHRRVIVPLGGPANRQGRTAADHIFGNGSAIPYPGTIGTAIVRVFDTVAGLTGYTEKRLMEENIPYRFVIVTAPQHAGYYPGAVPVVVKILWSPESGRLLGGQVVGCDGVDKRVDILSTAIMGHLTIEQVCHLELAYAPPFGSAKDVINIAGFAAHNIQSGLLEPAYDVTNGTQQQIVDVRPPESVTVHPVPGAIAIPLEQLRARLHELDKTKPVVTVCALGKMSYFAYRILVQNGFKASAFIGGWDMRSQKPVPPTNTRASHEGMVGTMGQHNSAGQDIPPLVLDTCGLSCPGPILKIKDTLPTLRAGQTLVVRASDPGFAKDFPAYCAAVGLTFLGLHKEKGICTAEATKATAPDDTQSTTHPANSGKRAGATLVVFSCDLDKVLASFIVATGAAAMGGPVTMFFTFWGLNVLRAHGGTQGKQKTLLDRLFCRMMPQGIDALPLSQFHMLGIGTGMMKSKMTRKKLPTLPMLLEEARKANIRLVACSMSMDAMGIAEEELISGVEIGGVADFLAACQQSGTNLFI